MSYEVLSIKNDFVKRLTSNECESYCWHFPASYLENFADVISRRALFGLNWLVLGDAMGVPVQFKPRGSYFHINACYATKDIPAGTYSDDTAMTFATISGLMHNFNNLYQDDYSVIFDSKAIMESFASWFMDGQFTQDGEAWDIGNTTRTAMENYCYENMDADKCGCTDDWSNGNGSLMRMFPVSYFIAVILFKKLLFNEEEFSTALEKLLRLNRKMSALTHGADTTLVACDIYTVLIIFILDGVEKRNLLPFTYNAIYNVYNRENSKHLITLRKFERIFKPDFRKTDEDDISSSGYVLDTLEAAIWCFLTTENSQECVEKAVNLGEDTDTIGAIAGSIAGCYYADSYPQEKIREPKNCIFEDILMEYPPRIYYTGLLELFTRKYFGVLY